MCRPGKVQNIAGESPRSMSCQIADLHAPTYTADQVLERLETWFGDAFISVIVFSPLKPSTNTNVVKRRLSRQVPLHRPE